MKNISLSCKQCIVIFRTNNPDINFINISLESSMCLNTIPEIDIHESKHIAASKK